MSYRDWKMGDRVVCVDDIPGPYIRAAGGRYNEDIHGLLSGQTYTIREIGLLPSPHPNAGDLVVKLVEIHRPIADPRVGEVGYDVRRFRPVQPRKTDISVFTALLHTNKQKVGA